MRISLDGRIHTDGAVVALGMFDGVHIGHQVLLQKAKTEALRARVPMVVQTFAEHPLCLLAPEKCPPLLTTLEERIALMEQQGVDIFCATPFDAETRDQLPEEFVGLLVRQWRPRAVVVGFNYSFGAHGAGNPAMLMAMGRALGFETFVVPAIRVDGAVVSASAIRDKLERGNAGQAFTLLNRAYARDMRLCSRTDTECLMQNLQDGKLNLPAGHYRVILTCGGHRSPALLKVQGDGFARCQLPPHIALAEKVTVAFVTDKRP